MILAVAVDSLSFQYSMKTIPAGVFLTQFYLSDRVAPARDLFAGQSLVPRVRRGHCSMLQGSMSVCSELVMRREDAGLNKYKATAVI